MRRRHGVGDIEAAMPSVILRLTTDEDIVGWGEASPWSVFTGTAEACASGIHVYLRPILEGADPFRTAAIMDRCQHALVAHTEAKAAVESALLDIVGKAAGRPVCDLLGGRVRDVIPLSCSIADPEFEADLDWARARIADGIRIFKVKTGFLDHAQDMRRMERLRTELPGDLDLRIDYNQGLEAWDAVAKVRDMERFRPTFIEQPVARPHRHAMAAIARAIDTPIMADESCFDPEEAIECVRLQAADLFAVKIMKSGGLRRAQAVAEIGAAAGIACYGGTMFEGGLANAAGAHLVGATQNISLGAEFYTARFVLAEDVLAEPLAIRDGGTVVPEGPGLGVTVDEAKVRKYAIHEAGR
ncbi:MAG: cycloisomerase [Alphaproteobacteria bacterium]|nr:cycloisomerase [Alphaproteobacteria bacterium]